MYAVDVEFNGLTLSACEVIGSQLPVALIGRNVLNQFVAEFDGPALRYSLR